MNQSKTLLTGVAIGVGAAVLVPLALTALAPVLRPAVRSALKTGLRAYESGRETLAEWGEMVEDIAAEVDAELHEEKLAAAVEPMAEAAAPAAAASTEHAAASPAPDVSKSDA